MRLEPYGFFTNPFHSAEITGEWYRYFLTPTMRGFSFKARAKSVLPVRRVPSRINFGQSFVTIGLMIGLTNFQVRDVHRCAGNSFRGYEQFFRSWQPKSSTRAEPFLIL